ncbi:MAG: helix-turn-helix domain-containing protein [Defluviitaleaceae bacterium]|nr:helix-turn-helix domain-containing protein [Defluviitaleaceae bacterium]
MDLLKYQLLDEIFKLANNHDVTKIKKMEDKLSVYLETNSSDAQIEDGLRMLKAFSVENKDNDFDISQELVAPIFERLADTDKWDFYDIKLISAVLGGASTAEQAYNFSKKTLKELKAYSDDKLYKNVKLSIYMNTLSRLLRAKYFDSDNLIPSNELAIKFSDYHRAIMDMCSSVGAKLNMYKAIATIRRGFFYSDADIQKQGFDMLEACGSSADEVYRMMKADAEQFKYFTDLNMSKQQFNIIIGRNIKKKRLEAGLTLQNLAAICGFTKHVISKIEIGKEGLSVFATQKISDALKVPIDVFYEGINVVESTDPKVAERSASLKQLDRLLGKLTIKELDYMATVARALPDARG